MTRGAGMKIKTKNDLKKETSKTSHEDYEKKVNEIIKGAKADGKNETQPEIETNLDEELKGDIKKGIPLYLFAKRYRKFKEKMDKEGRSPSEFFNESMLRYLKRN